MFDEKVRAAWGAFWRGVVARPARLFKPVYLQALGIIQAPDLLPDGRTDMCDSCPDMCVHEGTLVHSCRWDEWRLYGGYLSPHLQQSTPESEPARELAHH